MKLFLYLASRKKEGIKLVAAIQGESQITSRVTDINSLKLPDNWKKEVQQIVYDNRMLYELWAQSANNYQELREQLKSQGYKHVPAGISPMLRFGDGNLPKADTSTLKVRSVMVRKRRS